MTSVVEIKLSRDEVLQAIAEFIEKKSDILVSHTDVRILLENDREEIFCDGAMVHRKVSYS